MGIEQLVNAYKGNPAPLEAKVQQAQKNQPPGAIPPDLEEAIALQKITELQQGAKDQQAMQAGGAQPSVVEKLRQMLASAQQRQQAQPPQMPQMAQQPQMAQGPQSVPPQAPPQPPVMAAHGGSIAHLMSNLGRHYNGGGIVAFDDGGDVGEKAPLRPYPLSEQGADWEARRQAEREQEEKDKRDAEILRQLAASVAASPAEKAIAKVEPYKGPRQYTLQQQGADWEARLQKQREEDAKKPEDEMLKLVKMPFQAAGRSIMGGLKSLYGQQTPGEMPEQAGADQNEGQAIMQAARNRAEAERADNESRAVPIGNEAQRRLPSISGQGLPAALAAAAANKTAGGAGSAGGAGRAGGVGGADRAPMPAGLAGLPASGVGHEYERRMLAENQKFDPEAYKQKYLQEVGKKDTSIYDEMAAELKARKERLNNPEPGFDSLMEYLGQIAQGGGGRNWMEAGAKGAAGMNALRKSRQEQQDALVDKILDLGAKKKEAEYNERLGMFNLTKTEKDRIDKDSREIAKSLSLSEDKEAELKQNMVIETMKIKANKEIAGMPGAEQKFFNQIAGDWLSKPENKGKTMADAYAAYKLAGSPSAQMQPTKARDIAEDNVRKDLENTMVGPKLQKDAIEALKKSGIASPSMLEIKEYLVRRQMAAIGSQEAASSGKVPPPPAGFKPD